MTLVLKRFRTRRTELPQVAPPPRPNPPPRQTGKIGDDAFMPSANDDGFGDMKFATAGSGRAPLAGAQPVAGAPASVPAPAEGSAIEAIRREGLTGRQLRMARRLAQKHGLPATSDFDAVRLLRAAGIDPFQPNSALELVSDAAPAGGALALSKPGDGVKLPQTIKPMQVPSTEMRVEEAHIAEVSRIQADIVRRRRRKSLLLMARLTAFILLPTLLCAYYFYNVATPMYSTHTEFVIAQADPAASSGLGGMGGGLLKSNPLGGNQDSIAVQGYLNSMEAMLRLDKDQGFRAHFADPRIDPIQRLAPDAPDSIAYKTYHNKIRVSYDPTEMVVKMDVIAADPELAVKFSRSLISYAEEQVAGMSQRLREDQMKGAEESYATAERNLDEANRKVIEIQERLNVFDATVEASMLTSQISSLDSQITNDRLSLEQMLASPTPNPSRVEPLKRRIATLENEIAIRRAKLTQDSGDGISVAKMQSQLLVAQSAVKTRELLLTQAATALEAARVEVARQNRYLNVSVNPVLPDYPAYPKAFENTLLAALFFAGVYLLISMTIATLREQMSA